MWNRVWDECVRFKLKSAGGVGRVCKLKVEDSGLGVWDECVRSLDCWYKV